LLLLLLSPLDVDHLSQDARGKDACAVVKKMSQLVVKERRLDLLVHRGKQR
jgi:hypothetical protein